MIEDTLIKNAKKNPNKIAIICGAKRITFNELVNSIYSYSDYLGRIKKKTTNYFKFKKFNRLGYILFFN